MSRAVRRPVLAGVLATLVALATALVPGSVQAGPASPRGADSHAAQPARTATVMTRNLYLGADLNGILVALAGGNPTAILTAATQTWNAVQATRPEERMAAVADEIVAADPAVVGLQEVTEWTTFAYNPQTQTVSNPVVAYDFLDLLLDALAARGADYREVAGATAHNFTSPPIPVLTGTGLRAVRLADRDVILARADVETANARTGTYQNIIGFPYAGSTLPVARGWGSTDVRVERARFRFVNSHLEAFGIPGIDGEQVRYAQVGELLAAQAAVTAQSGALPMVYVGDYNSAAPDAPAYSRLLAGVGVDAWVRDHPDDRGLTCCFDDAVSDPADPLTSRIDLVLVSRDVKAPRAAVVGDDPADLTPSGLWPSDHAGVVARLVFPARR